MRDLTVAAETTTSSSSSTFFKAAQQQQHPQQYHPQSPPPPEPPTWASNSPEMIIDEFHKTYYLSCMQEEYNNRRRAATTLAQATVPKPPKKRVTFSQDAYLYPGDVTHEEVKQSWCTMDDFRRFKEDRKEAVRRMRRSDFNLERLEQQGFCVRGLEPYFSLETNRAMKYSRELSFRMVLDEQQRQRNMGTRNAEDLRNQACIATEWARDVAQQLGASDAEEARRIQDFCPPPQPGAVMITNRSRAEFMRTAALQRRESSRKMRIEDCQNNLRQEQQEKQEEDRYSELLLKKLKSALNLADSTNISSSSNSSKDVVNTSDNSEINPAA